MSKKRDKTDSHSQPHIDAEDAALFRGEMDGVRPLADDNRVHAAPPKPRAGFSPRHDEHDDAAQQSSGFIQSGYVENVGPDETLLFTRPGLQHKIVKRLRRGELKIEETLDLHGFTIAEAAQALSEFLHHARASDLRNVLIIHGRGHRSQDNMPVLKSQVNHWLRQHEAVLGFSSAKPQNGGAGAVYVLLRKGAD